MTAALAYAARVRTAVAALLIVAAACGKEDQAALDRAEREDRPRGLTVKAEVDPGAGGYNPLLAVGPPPPALGRDAALFVELMADAVPREFCRDEMYFRACFAITENECRVRVGAALAVCVKLHRDVIPERPDGDSGRRAGEQLGSCAGFRYEQGLAAEGRRSQRAECDDLDRWR